MIDVRCSCYLYQITAYGSTASAVPRSDEDLEDWNNSGLDLVYDRGRFRYTRNTVRYLNGRQSRWVAANGPELASPAIEHVSGSTFRRAENSSEDQSITQGLKNSFRTSRKDESMLVCLWKVYGATGHVGTRPHVQVQHLKAEQRIQY